MRINLLAVALGVLLCVPVVANECVPSSFAVLQTKTSIDWQEQTFGEFVTWMRQHVGWNVSVRWSELESHGVTPDSLIAIHLKEVPVHVIVNEVFQQISTDITYHLTEHLMTISSRDDLNKRVYVRAYDLTDLIIQETVYDPPATNLQSLSSKISVSSSGFGDVVQIKSKESEEEIKLRIEGIIKSLKPNTWKGSGGNGTVSWSGNTLIVQNIVEVHEIIAGSFH